MNENDKLNWIEWRWIQLWL